MTEAPQCNRMTVTGRRQQKNNIQIGNVQNGKNTIYNTDNYEWAQTNLQLKNLQIWNKKISMYGE